MTPFKNYTGLTQEEMAIYLGVTRSQWSMFVVGKRKLPLVAAQKLNDLLFFLKHNNSIRSNSELLDSENKKLKLELNKKLRDLEVLSVQTEKKINHLFLIRQQLLTALSTLVFLKNSEHNTIELNAVIELRIKEGLTKNSLQKLVHYQQKKQNIENQIKMIKAVIFE